MDYGRSKSRVARRDRPRGDLRSYIKLDEAFVNKELETILTMQDRDKDSMFRGNNNDCRIYVGNLPEDCRERDVEDIFYKYGGIGDVRIKRGDSSRGRGHRGENLSYAFIQFDDPRDADDAVHGRDGYEFDGRRLRVEFTRGNQNNRRRGTTGGYHGRGRGRGVPPRRSNHRVNVKGLPSTGSWQDLKDHMREAGEVLYAEVFGDGSGIVEFAHSDDVKYALKNLDDTDFRSHEGDNGRITVNEDSHSGSRRSKSYSRSRSRSRDRSRSRSRSKSRDRSRSPRDRSKSPRDRSKSRSKSPAKSRSRSPNPN